MFRVLCSSGLLLVFTAVSLGPAQVPEPVKAQNPVIQLARRLNERVDFDGIPAGQRMTFGGALDLLRDRYKLNFDVNESAFRADGIDDVLAQPIAATRPMPKMSRVRLETVIRKLLAQITTQSGATFVLREDGLEITTSQARVAEFYWVPPSKDAEEPRPLVMPLAPWGFGGLGGFGGGLGGIGGVPARSPEEDATPRSGRLALPLVQAEFDKRPLDEALRELAATTHANIVISAAVAERVKLPVTASLLNVPLDTAVMILTDMAQLQPVLIDTVLYVTTPENAARIRDLDRQRGKQLVGNGERGVLGAGGLNGPPMQ